MNQKHLIQICQLRIHRGYPCNLFCLQQTSLSSNRQHLSSDDCLEDKKIITTVLCCIVYDSCTQRHTHMYEQFLQLIVGLALHPANACG